jgi:hypothetical protein
MSVRAAQKHYFWGIFEIDGSLESIRVNYFGSIQRCLWMIAYLPQPVSFLRSGAQRSLLFDLPHAATKQ